MHVCMCAYTCIKMYAHMYETMYPSFYLCMFAGYPAVLIFVSIVCFFFCTVCLSFLRYKRQLVIPRLQYSLDRFPRFVLRILWPAQVIVVLSTISSFSLFSLVFLFLALLRWFYSLFVASGTGLLDILLVSHLLTSRPMSFRQLTSQFFPSFIVLYCKCYCH